MAADYDSIAWSYDFLSRIVFGTTLIQAQLCLIPYIPAGSKILIVGGGTGWILESIAERYPEGLQIDYVDSSERMLALAGKRNCKSNVVNFIHQSIENYSAPSLYDVVITTFLFDNFTDDKAAVIFNQLDLFIKPGGLWLYADYNSSDEKPLWQKLLLATMYIFFRLVSHVEAKRMAAMGKYFEHGYKVAFQTSHYAGFIDSIAYRRI